MPRAAGAKGGGREGEQAGPQRNDQAQQEQHALEGLRAAQGLWRIREGLGGWSEGLRVQRTERQITAPPPGTAGTAHTLEGLRASQGLLGDGRQGFEGESEGLGVALDGVAGPQHHDQARQGLRAAQGLRRRRRVRCMDGLTGPQRQNQAQQEQHALERLRTGQDLHRGDEGSAGEL